MLDEIVHTMGPTLSLAGLMAGWMAEAMHGSRGIGSRGSRGAAIARPVPDPPLPSPPQAVSAPPAPPAHRPHAWMARAAGLAIVGLIASGLVRAVGPDLESLHAVLLVLVLGGLGAVLLVRSRWRRVPAPLARAPAGVPGPTDAPPAPAADSSLDEGLRDIRRTDPGFDPGRFVGYAGMMFRDAQRAWVGGDIRSLRDRVTPEMHGELQAHYDRWRRARRANRVDEIDVTAEVTEAWQENGRDYVTAYISGSIVDYTVDEASDRLVDGSRTTPRSVAEFWTFTRPQGLHFWMLSAIEIA